MEVNFYNSRYQGAPSVLERTETFPDGEAGFKKFYHTNNSYKYCNGTHYTFVNPKDREAYNVFVKTYNTIENYYNGGVVD